MKRPLIAMCLLAACEQRVEVPAMPAALPRPSLSRGIDLSRDQLPAIPKDIEAAWKERPARALGDDLQAAEVGLPKVFLGATASLDLDGGARGWITRVADQPIPSVAYGDQRVFVGGGFVSTAFHALDASTGRIEWTKSDLADDGPTAALYDDGRVIFNTESCTLFVVDAQSGKTLWSKYLGDPTLSQPAYRDGVVYAAFPEAGTPKLGAFKVQDGALIWSRTIDGELLSAPVIDGGAIYATTILGTTYRFALDGGKQRWSASMHASSAPFVIGDELFQSRADLKTRREEQLLISADTGQVIKVLRSAPASYLFDVPRTLGDNPSIWAFEGSRPVIAGGRRFDTMGGEIQASDPRTGAALWRRSHAGSEGKRRLTAPVVAGAKLVFATYDGEVYGLDVDTGLTVFAYRFDATIHTQPIVARGWVYLTTVDGRVIGLPIGDPTLDGWHMWGGSAARNG